VFCFQWAWPFASPVDTSKYPDYTKAVAQPMDFGTIRARCESGHYKDPEEFVYDVNLIFENARKYNPPQSDVVVMGRAVQVQELLAL
jgi:Bromodomain